jgi:cytochrome c oxidase cbb3-type subunit 4
MRWWRTCKCSARQSSEVVVMDLNDLRSAITLLSFVMFIGLVLWAWSARRRSSFDEAAQLPFDGDEGQRT